MRIRILLLCGLVELLLLSFVPRVAQAAPAAAGGVPEQHMAQGWQAFERGDFARAVVSWTAAGRLYERAGQPVQQSNALTHLAQAYQALGQYKLALQSLHAALGLAEKSGEQGQVAAVMGSLGNAYIVTGPAEKAAGYLEGGLKSARELGDAALAAAILNNLGNLLTLQHKYDEALAAYTESIRLAEDTANHALAVRALTNAAMTSIQHGQQAAASALLDRAVAQMQGLGPTHETAYGWVNIGLAYNGLRPALPTMQERLLLSASRAFNEAMSVAKTIGDPRAASYAAGYLGTLYEAEKRYEEALQLTRQAVFAAQQVHAPEALYRWQWQTGRLFKALSQIDDAIAAYRRAVDTLQTIRLEMAVGYGGPASFREAVGPVYFELVDLLLQRAAALTERAAYEPYLTEARNTVESFKVAELQDYFRDDCVEAAQASSTPLDVVSKTAVVIYPILLPDRTELLVSLPTGLQHFTVRVDANTMTEEIRELRRKLEKRTTREYLPHAQTLYNWLMRPLEPVLTPLAVETLVFVPDGPLRTIPMAALHDGKEFLISKYAIATTPGLKLTNPRPIQRADLKVLAVGLTEAVQGFPALPYVSAELDALQHLYSGNVLLNQRFRIPTMTQEMRKEQFTVVHIASHGQFKGEVEKTFLLTFDDKITMDRLDQLIGLIRFRDDPLELLTLSACQTAAGDDRAALGLAGVAIKAGARSALASLWFVSDQASSALVTAFYQELQNPTVSRAVALQRAQVQLLQEQRYQHPAYWAPFLLLNNWL
jgi:CHAT domain-containing protein